MSFRTTGSQTIGPYLHIGLTWLITDSLVAPGVQGTPVVIEGRVTDGDGEPVNDAVVEVWQANANGRYPHPEDTGTAPLEPGFTGFGRVYTDAGGLFRFTTIKPGRVPAPGGGLQAPHINVSIFARGVLNRLATRLYFDGDPALGDDPVLKLVEPQRRDTLIAKRDPSGAWRLPIHLGGPNETVFFDV